jgi:hypothetical protein
MLLEEESAFNLLAQSVVASGKVQENRQYLLALTPSRSGRTLLWRFIAGGLGNALRLRDLMVPLVLRR